MTVVEKLGNNVAEVNSAFQNIKSKIASHGVEVANELRPSEYASKVDAVYEAGKQAQYDAFWDTIQDFGKRVNYSLALCGDHWTKEFFKPKYPIKPTISMVYCFAYWYGLTGTKELIDFREACELDTSNVKITSYAFYDNQLVYAIGIVDLRNADKITTTFHSARNLAIVEKIILGDNYASFTGMFRNCTALEEVRFEGVISKNDFDVQWSTKLSKASITSIINALSATTSGLSVTLSKTAVNKAFETTAGAGDGSTSAEWQSLIAPKSNWTISLV